MVTTKLYSEKIEAAIKQHGILKSELFFLGLTGQAEAIVDAMKEEVMDLSDPGNLRPLHPPTLVAHAGELLRVVTCMSSILGYTLEELIRIDYADRNAADPIKFPMPGQTVQ